MISKASIVERADGTLYAHSGTGAIVADKLTAWLLDGVFPDMGMPISLRPNLTAWRKRFAAGTKQPASGRLFKMRAAMEYRAAAASPAVGIVLEKAILQRMLRDGAVKWMRRDREPSGWPVLIGRDTALRFSPFSTYLAAALHNAMSQLQSLSAMSSRDLRWTTLEFLHQARKTISSATVGDLLAAHILRQAADELGPRFRAAAEQAGRRRFADFFRYARWKARLEQARSLAEWAEDSLRLQFARYDPLAPLLNVEGGRFDAKGLRLLSRVVGEGLPPGLAAWLATRMSGYLNRGQFLDIFPLLREWLGGSSSIHSRQFAARVVHGAIISLPRPVAEEGLARLTGDAVHRFGPLCGRLSTRIFDVRTARRPEKGFDPEIWDRLEGSMARLVWTGLRCNIAGQRFTGEFLLQIFSELGPAPLADFSAAVPQLKLMSLMRVWARVTLKTRGDDGNVSTVIEDLREKLAASNIEMARALRTQRIIVGVRECARQPAAI